ncbi:hypothetical protein [Myxosarcina sp. GI1]|uniref:hypothetical protein n=1 Tax=Myxosarcina sp. GI1 TaxID=1541065 RepID=UPI0005661E19|nr:hypothetical protein [Myxosarcina sp. GI1]
MLWLLIILIIWSSLPQLASARQTKPNPTPAAELVCFSGGREILRENIVAGPFADEYKFAHEVKVRDERGEHSINFAGGLCIIDRGEASVYRELNLTDELSCYSGANEVVSFKVYGRETTVDEYVEGRTFLAKAKGSFSADSLHEYLVFGGGACIGEEVLK